MLHLELRRPGVTLALLWEEYRARQPAGYGYSWFCERYRAWAGRLSPTMRQTHVAGEKMFVDFAGQTVEVTELASGEVRQAQIFVAVLGASNYTYAEARWTQSLPDWVGAHGHAFGFFGGVPRQTVYDYVTGHIIARARARSRPVAGGRRDMPAHRKTRQIGPQILAAPAHTGSLRAVAGLGAQPLDDAARRRSGLSLAM